VVQNLRQETHMCHLNKHKTRILIWTYSNRFFKILNDFIVYNYKCVSITPPIIWIDMTRYLLQTQTQTKGFFVLFTKYSLLMTYILRYLGQMLDHAKTADVWNLSWYMYLNLERTIIMFTSQWLDISHATRYTLAVCVM